MKKRRVWAVVVLCWVLSLGAGVGQAAQAKGQSPDTSVIILPNVQTGIVPDLIISEIMQNPAAVSDANGEWLELYNAGDASFNLDGCILRDLGTDNHTINNGGPLVITPGAYLVLGRNGSSGSNGGLAVDYEYTGFTLGNTADEVILDCDGAEIDRVVYDGGPDFPDPTGASMQLLSPSLDNNNGGNWCEATGPWPGSNGDFGTPGGDTVCLSINKTASPLTDVPLGGEVTYEITLNNPTGFAVNPVSVTDALPAEVDFNRWLNQPAGASVVGDQLAWTGMVGAQGSVRFRFVVDHVGSYGDQVTNQVEYSYAGSSTSAQVTFTVEPRPFVGEVVVNEIMPNPDAVNDTAGEWLELFNPGSVPVDLNSCILTDDGGSSHTIDNGGALIIEPGNYLVLGINDDAATNGNVTLDYDYDFYFLANGDDEVVLVCGNTEVDRVNYNSGFPFAAGASMQLHDPALNNNSSANWCQSSAPWSGSAGDFGSPGEANVCPADLRVTKSVNPATVRPGQGFEYTLNFTNLGPALAGGVVLTDIVPIYMTGVTVSNSGATINPLGGLPFIWTVEELSPGEGGTITIQGDLDAPLPRGFVFSNTAQIGASMPDPAQGNNQDQVRVTVRNAQPRARDDSAVTTEENPITIAVLDNDSDPNDDGLALVSVANPANGTAAIDGLTVVYTPALNFAGQERFTYEVSDGSLNDSATIEITVNPLNDRPVAQDDTAQTDEDVSVAISVLENDSDTDGNLNPASVQVTIDPANGSAVGEPATGEITYSPEPNFNGVDSFTYRICDDGTPLPPRCATASVTITVHAVNDPPQAVDDTALTYEDMPLTLSVLNNDTDNDGDLVSASLAVINGPANGLAQVLAVSGQIVYTPGLNFNGTDILTYEICDNGSPPPARCAAATVTVTISPVNDPPTLYDDLIEAEEDTPLVISVLSNDSDLDGDSLTLHGLGLVPNGTAIISGSSVVYTPVLNFNGPDSFTYLAGDGLLSDTARVTITVTPINDPPLALDDLYFGQEDADLTVLAASGVLSNDFDVESDALTATLVSDVLSGTLTFFPDGSFIYAPSLEFSGAVTFTYLADDGDLLSNVATTTLLIGVKNDPPIAGDDLATTDEDMPLDIVVLSNDDDPDGQLILSSITVMSGPVYGTASPRPAGTIFYQPAANFNGSDGFSYQICDDGLPPPILCATAGVSIHVKAVNDPPLAIDDQPITMEDEAVTVYPLANDLDVDGDTLAIINLSQPVHGAATLSQTALVYKPDLNFNGAEILTYAIDDGLLSATASISLTVLPVNDPPYFVNLDIPPGMVDEPYTQTILVADVDANDSLTISAPLLPAWLSLSPLRNGLAALHGTPTAGDSGQHPLRLLASDGEIGVSHEALITVGESQPPLLTDNLYLPLLFRLPPPEPPDLIVESLVVARNAVTVVIKNIGGLPVNDAFWVDVYIDPSSPPAYNLTWPLIAEQGVVWGVTDPIPPGGELTLTLGGAYYFPAESYLEEISSGMPVWAQVDSANIHTTYGGVLEGDEANNLFGPVTAADILVPHIPKADNLSQQVGSRSLPGRR